jgi:hypothetical protein
MTGVTDLRPEQADAPDEPAFNHTGSLAVAVVVGLALGITARLGATALLVAIAAVQAVLALAWVYGTGLRGRRGALVLAGLAAAGADVCVSLWSHSRLGPLLIVVGLAVPVLFVHQLLRGAARTKVVDSLGAIAALVLAEAALPALLQLRHEFARTSGLDSTGGAVVSGVVTVMAGALVVGYLIDLLAPAPRFDPAVPRGLLAVLASTGLGGSLGYVLLQSDRLVELHGGRGAFLGAALGALVSLLAVGAAFDEHAAARPAAGASGAGVPRLRPVLGVLVPFAVLAPVAFLLSLAIRV